ncbi:hypothetical protein BDB01DRAFT_809463 [Pilobolus umbonatus]|nr:hypothetical protein BDB01DRAFT_809463 [Pilobolus umbonatus]
MKVLYTSDPTFRWSPSTITQAIPNQYQTHYAMRIYLGFRYNMKASSTLHDTDVYHSFA